MTLSPAVRLTGLPEPIQDALTLLADESTPVEDRAALWATLHQAQLRINRVLRKSKDALIVHMEGNGLKEMGPLSVKATAFDVEWPVNDPGNWEDAQLQDELAMFARLAPDYITRVPEHWQLETAALGTGLVNNDPVAVKLHRHAKDAGWRREGGRRYGKTWRPLLLDYLARVEPS